MKAEPLIIAWTPPELALLGPDGRLLRRTLQPEDDPSRLLAELWAAEFPEDRAGKLLSSSPDPAALRRFCAAARRAGGRLVSAGAWEGAPLETPDHELAERMAGFQPDVDLLARRGWTAPSWLRSRRGKGLTALVVALAAGAAAVWHVRAAAWRHQRTAAEEAARELDAAQAAAGLRRRQNADEEERLARVLNPSQIPIREFLLALSAAANRAVVVDQVVSRGDEAQIIYRILSSAPDATDPDKFTAALREAGKGQGIELNDEPAAVPPSPTEAAGWPARVSQTKEGRFHAPPRGEDSLSVSLAELARGTKEDDIRRTLARLPTVDRINDLIKTLNMAWLAEPGVEDAVTDQVSSREIQFVARDEGRGAWERLLALTDALEHTAGTVIVAVNAVADGSETGAFGEVAVTAKLLFLRR